MDRVLGVIAARGGSKRIPRKNLQTLDGKPLIAYAIDDAQAADRIDEFVVSTEDEEIRSVAETYDAPVPFERPAELATDTATTNDVVAHVLDRFQDRGEQFDAVCSIPVPSPFREPDDVDGALEILASSDADSVVGITEFDPPPFWAVDSDERGFLRPYFDESSMWTQTRSQEMPTVHRPNGAVFAATVSAFRKHGSFYTDQTTGYEMPPYRSIDIDEPIDLEIARGLVRDHQ